ncbi:MAG: hypothetical protein IPQ08_09150 [Chitinophagaceae bacterium]|nr:hypothetical protein [Chitinophagaceae bacterium]
MEFSISNPTLAEQHRIVAKIEELFSELDKGIEMLQTARQQLKVYRQAVLKWAFEGRLTNPELADGEVPLGWNKYSIRETCHNIKVGIVIKPSVFYAKSGKGVPVFRSANVREFRVNDSDWVYFSEKETIKITEQKFLKAMYCWCAQVILASCVVPKKFDGCNAIDVLIANQQKLFCQIIYVLLIIRP